jgi:2-dehydro-3-deoxygalactonokinase
MMMSNQTAAQDHPASSLFLSCDWGTSSFRLRLIDVQRGEKLAETRRDVGVKSIYLQSVKEGVDRGDLFKNFLIRECQDMLESKGVKAASIRMMLSGMASSSIGWVDLPYARMPFPLDGSGAIIQSRELLCHSGTVIECRLISGVCSQDEMMRGEETELMGVFSLPSYRSLSGYCLAVVPGTHSKHVLIRDGVMQSVQTYMTGELLEVLSRHSVLQATVDLKTVFEQKFKMIQDSQQESFKCGVLRAKQTGLLGGLFQARTRGVLYSASAQDNIWFLLGLLIGEELLQINRHHPEALPVLIAAGARFSELYRMAADHLETAGRLQFVDADDLDNASWLGQKVLI